MNIADAQRENRIRFVGGFYGQLVSGILWLTSACLATWSTPKAAIATLILGGFLIFPLTETLVRLHGAKAPLSANPLSSLGMQVALVLPLSMPLVYPVSLYRLNLFYPALTILLGAHYCPFVTLYGMRMFAVLAALLVGGGVLIAMYQPTGGLTPAAWYTAVLLLIFAFIGRFSVSQELARASVAKSAEY